MTVARKNKRNKKQPPRKTSVIIPAGKGYDFGLRQKVMLVADQYFNQKLMDAEIIGCAYGYMHPNSPAKGIPVLTLAGKNKDKLIEAYKHFERWGCQEDGDVVKVDILLNHDGSYDLWISPDFDRFNYRTMPQHDLYDVISMNISWVKHINSTNPVLLEIKDYCKQKISPVILSAVTCQEANPSSFKTTPIDEWKDIIIFNLNILTPEEANKDPKYSLLINKRKKPNDPEKISPDIICSRRNKFIDTVFPVSRERIRRSGIIQKMIDKYGKEDLKETQIIQAIVNITLSNEINSEDLHYESVSEDLDKTICDHISDRIEVANGDTGIACSDVDEIYNQIHLDIISALHETKQKTNNRSFSQLQKIFNDKGYVDE